jgi:integrase
MRCLCDDVARRSVRIVSSTVATLSDYIAAATSHAASTLQAYAKNRADFELFCSLRAVSACPASVETLLAYIETLARSKYATATIERACSAIASAHRDRRLPSPTEDFLVRKALRGIRRLSESAGHQKDALPVSFVEMISNMDTRRSIDYRDQALLLTGFFGALTRSQLVSLDIDDLSFSDVGLTIHVGSDKTDPLYDSGLIKSLRRWLRHAEITEGAVFRPVHRSGSILDRRLTDQVVALIVKRRMVDAGFDPSKFSGHSLRAGFVTSAASNGSTDNNIASITRHRSLLALRKNDRRSSYPLFHMGKTR